MKKGWLALLCAALLLACGLALGDENGAYYDSIPQTLRFTQKMGEYNWVQEHLYTLNMIPQTANAQVNSEMSALILGMENKARPYLPNTRGDSSNSHLITAASISRSGTSIMSFLTTASVTHLSDQIYIDYDARTYNMETGAQLKLTDVFPADSEMWDLLADEVFRQVNAYFQGTTPEPLPLLKMCARQSLENASFTMTPASLVLTYPAQEVYPGHVQLLHVRLYYRDIRRYMTEEMQWQTDNSRYRLIALTYDDGCARGDSVGVVNQLRRYGANATFFVIGVTIPGNHDVLAYEHDSGFSIGSHNYVHTYSNLTRANILSWKEQYERDLNAAIGIKPTLMRAPGGNDQPYCAAGVGMPVMHWSFSPEDAGSNASRIDGIANRVGMGTEAGDVVLMHDVNPNCRSYTAQLLPMLEERNIMCVTVEELYSHYGVQLQANQAYTGLTDAVPRPY